MAPASGAPRRTLSPPDELAGLARSGRSPYLVVGRARDLRSAVATGPATVNCRNSSVTPLSNQLTTFLGRPSQFRIVGEHLDVGAG